MINKNFYRKTNDKKILHKVGKQWKVVSVALLMAIGGAAVATHVSANADDVAGTQPYAANQAQFAPKQASAKPQQQKSSAGVSYYPAASGSAAYYFDRQASNEGVAAKNYNTVNSYVQSLNAEYNPEVHSYSAKSASASNASVNDVKLAKSYSAVVNKPSTTKTVDSLATANHMDPQLYQGMVQNNEQFYSGEVKSASADVKANNDVASLVNSLEGADLTSADAHASYEAVSASSALVGAIANSNSVYARTGHDVGNNGDLVSDASALSYGADELAQAGNGMNYNANLGTLNYTNVNSESALMSGFNSAVSHAVTSARNEYNGSSAANNINGYVNEHHYNNELVSSSAYNVPTLSFDHDQNSEFNSAVSAATDTRFATYLASAATSLYAKYAPGYAGYRNNAYADSKANASASAAVRAASFEYDNAFANSVIVNSVSTDAVRTTGGKAQVAKNYLNEGVTTFDNNVANAIAGARFKDNGIDGGAMVYTYNSDPAIETTGDATSSNPYYLEAVVKALGSNNDAINLLKNHLNSGSILGITEGVTKPSNVKVNIENAEGKLSNLATFFNELSNDTTIPTSGKLDGVDMSSIYSDFTGSTVGHHIVLSGKWSSLLNSLVGSNSLVKAILTDNDILPVNAAGDLKHNNVKDIANNVTKENANLEAIANAAGSITGGATQHNGLQVSGKVANNAAHEVAQAALLSDGVDMAQLEAESGAIANVASAANSASNSVGFRGESAAEKLGNELSVAASSANSAANSAASASDAYSQANDENVTLASYYASSYNSDASNESALANSTSSALNEFFKDMADDNEFTTADDAYAGAEAAAANDKELGEEYSKVVYNNSPHFLDVLKNAKLHSFYNYGSKEDNIVGTANKGDRLTVLGVNFSREGNWRGQTRYLVVDNNTGKKGFFTGQPQYSKATYLNSKLNTNNVDVSVKTLKPVNVMTSLNGGKVVKTLKAGTVVDGVTIVNDNPSNDAMGFTKVETSDYNFFTANTDYVVLNNVVPTTNNNNNPNPFNFGLGNVTNGLAYNDYGQIK